MALGVYQIIKKIFSQKYSNFNKLKFKIYKGVKKIENDT